MSNLKMRVAISLTSAIAIIATAGLAVAKPDKKMAREKIVTEKSMPAEDAPAKGLSDTKALPENQPTASIVQSEPPPSPAPTPDVAVEAKIPLPTMDTNGDSRPDAWDRDSNGVADAWDTDGDDKPDALDNDGDGKPDMKKKESSAGKPEAQPR
jgi:hypothetical protein